MYILGRSFAGIVFVLLSLVPLFMAIYALIMLKAVKDNTEATRELLQDIKEVLRQRE
jgi:hypothetical protein